MSNTYLASRTAYQTLTTVIEEQRTRTVHEAPLILHLTPRKTERPHVTWAEGTIDNEHLNRLKSNCCCIWVKPRVWDDPTTWEQDECEVEHCRGHTLPVPSQPNDKDTEQ